uniref:Uncharacterized protein n=1 Tax=Arundo donax TaxID=35708 RepID=A0A0A9CH04_ARUDO
MEVLYKTLRKDCPIISISIVTWHKAHKYNNNNKAL